MPKKVSTKYKVYYQKKEKGKIPLEVLEKRYFKLGRLINKRRKK